MSKIIAIANQKGGVGKTTTAINLGIGLVNKGNKVLLVDLDPQGNATQGLGFEADNLEITISTILRRIINKDYSFMKDYGILSHPEGISLMPANIELSVLETELISIFFGREKVLKTYLDMVRSEYDYILIDCMSSLNLIAINALVAADEIIIPLHAQYYSVRGLEQLLQTIGSIKSNGLNDSIKISGILYTCVNNRTTSFRGVQEILKNAYGENIRIYDNYIPRSVKAEEAPSYGQSIYEYDTAGKVSSAYSKFTEEFLSSMDKRGEEMAVKGFNVMDLGKAGLLDPAKMGYTDSLGIIKDESFKVQKSFVKIGWYLKHIVSRNTVAEVQALFLQSGKSWDDISEWDDDSLYGLFYPDKFKYKPRYAPVDYSYVHKELKKTGVTEKLLWEEYCARCRKDGSTPCSYITFAKNYKKFTADKNYTSHIEHKPGLKVEVDWSGPAMSYTEPDTGERVTAYLFVATMPYSQMCYVEATAGMDEKAWLSCHVNMFRFFGGTPVKIVCDNLKTGVTAHPRRGEIILNEAYLSLGEYYSVAIMPTGVRKPKQKASVEGSVGKTATAVIAKLRNDSFTSLAGLNAGIRKAVKEFNDRPFQKRPGSRQSIFETEEKPYLRALPPVPYEVCEWSYGHKVGSNSHIWWNKGQYSVPCRYIGCRVDVKFNSHLVFIYYNRTEIARHQVLPRHMANGIRTDEAHLPFPRVKICQWMPCVTKQGKSALRPLK